MTTSEEQIYSDMAIPPGEMLAEEMEFRNMPMEYLTAKLSQPAEVIDKIISGEHPITQEIADNLAEAFWIPAWFWIKLEARYRTTLARQWEKSGGEEEDWTRWCYGRIIRRLREEDEATDRAPAQSSR